MNKQDIIKMNKLIIPIIGAYPDVGKGTLSASLGYVLKKHGFKVTIIKFDGYFNIDSGNMNPYHLSQNYSYSKEEVFVLKDGYQADADHGYYERFLDQDFLGETCLTNGNLLNELLENIKKGGYKSGEILKYKTLRNLMKEKILSHLDKNDILIVEIGGTIGDEESIQMYLSLQEVIYEKKIDSKVIMLSPYFSSADKEHIELSSRTKLTRKAFLDAIKCGLRPDIIFLRSNAPILKNDLSYISSDCNLSKDLILMDPQVQDLYKIPEIIEKQGILSLLFYNKKFIPIKGVLEEYCLLKENAKKGIPLKIGIFGKTEGYDSYISLIEAVENASVDQGQESKIIWIDDLNNKVINNLDGVIISEGTDYISDKIKIINEARQKNIPLLAISFGCDLLVKEFCKNELKISVSLNELEGLTDYNIEKEDLVVGNQEINIKQDSNIKKIYNSEIIVERNKHCSYISRKLKGSLRGLEVVGENLDSKAVIFELKKNDFFIGVKFHPEFKTRPGKPHPIFKEFIKICKTRNLKDD